LGKAVKGLVVFSPDLEQVAEGCLQNKIPAPWMGVSYPSLKPFASYVDDFLLRWKFMTVWVNDGIPFSFWFSAFFFQQCFLTGVIQNFARGDKIAIDRCMWNYKVMKLDFTPEESPPVGAYIHGLMMNGGRWDNENMYLDDSHPKVLWCDMSGIWCKPVEVDNDETDPTKQYMCPVYKTSERKGVLSTSGHSSNYIMDISLDHKQEFPHDARFWTKRGMALITMTDD
jgi:dynein heavy chain